MKVSRKFDKAEVIINVTDIAGTTQKILNRAFKTSKFKGGSDIKYSYCIKVNRR